MSLQRQKIILRLIKHKDNIETLFKLFLYQAGMLKRMTIHLNIQRSKTIRKPILFISKTIKHIKIRHKHQFLNISLSILQIATNFRRNSTSHRIKRKIKLTILIYLISPKILASSTQNKHLESLYPPITLFLDQGPLRRLLTPIILKIIVIITNQFI